MPANELVDRCADHGVLVLPMSVSRIRAVANLGVDAAGIDRALDVIEQAVASSVAAADQRGVAAPAARASASSSRSWASASDACGRVSNS